MAIDSQQEPRHRYGAKRVGVQHAGLKSLVFLLLILLPAWGMARLWLHGMHGLPRLAPVLLYLAASLVTFGLYWCDKRKARLNDRRISEKVLHLGELAGGWPGALLAQQLFRHKTRKVPYLVMFWLIVGVHLVFWGAWLAKVF